MSQRTVFLSKLLGIYCIIVALSMIVSRQLVVETVITLVHNPPALFFAGLIAMVIGLAMILAHNIWSGGALPVIVTLIGWLTLIKGLLFLFLPWETVAGLYIGALHHEQLLTVDAAFLLALGTYLTYGGFRSSSR